MVGIFQAEGDFALISEERSPVVETWVQAGLSGSCSEAATYLLCKFGQVT